MRSGRTLSINGSVISIPEGIKMPSFTHTFANGNHVVYLEKYPEVITWPFGQKMSAQQLQKIQAFVNDESIWVRSFEQDQKASSSSSTTTASSGQVLAALNAEKVKVEKVSAPAENKQAAPLFTSSIRIGDFQQEAVGYAGGKVEIDNNEPGSIWARNSEPTVTTDAQGRTTINVGAFNFDFSQPGTAESFRDVTTAFKNLKM